MTDIHDQGHRPGEDVHHGDHGTQAASRAPVVHRGVKNDVHTLWRECLSTPASHAAAHAPAARRTKAERTSRPTSQRQLPESNGPLGVDAAAAAAAAARCAVTGWHASLRCRATTTCSWTPMTTRSTRPRSAAASRWPPLLTGVRVWCDGRLVADHVRCWARHQTISDPVHWPPRPSRATSRRCWGVTRHPSDADEVQLRQLTDDDSAFGLDDSQGA